MTTPTYTLGLELSPGSLTDVSSICLRAGFSRTMADLFVPIAADTGLFELANDQGSLAPLLNANLVVGRLVSFSATYGGSGFNLYKGRVKSFSNRPMMGERTTVIQAMTEVDRLDRQVLNTGMFVGYNAGSLFTEIMTRCAVQSFAAELVTDQIGFAWYQNDNARNALSNLLKSGAYQAFVDGAGTVQMKNRYFGNLTSAVDTLTVGQDVNYVIDDSRIVNNVRAKATPRQQVTAVSTVAYVAQPILIPASGGNGFFMTFFDPRNVGNTTPVGSVVALVSSQDYLATANSDGTGADLTSVISITLQPFGASAIASIFNGGGTDAWMTRLQIRGYPILNGADINTSTDDSSSQGVYGMGALQLDDVMITRQDYLRDLGSMIVGDRKDPRDTVRWALRNEFPAVLSYNAGDTLSAIHSLAGVNSLWSIRKQSHEVSMASGLDHRVEYTLERFNARPWLVLDHPTFGKLDSGRQLGL